MSAPEKTFLTYHCTTEGETHTVELQSTLTHSEVKAIIAGLFLRLDPSCQEEILADLPLLYRHLLAPAPGTLVHMIANNPGADLAHPEGRPV